MMKKILVFVLCTITLCACRKHSGEHVEPTIDYAGLLVGQWVYDHPEEGVWETLKFTSSGMFYYSNSSDILYDIENEDVNGRYFVDGDLITGTYELNNSILNIDIQIKKINAFEMVAKFNDVGLEFTYAKLLGSETVDYGEAISPNYYSYLTGLLTEGVRVLGYSSHNTKIAEVDASTGKITGMSSGRTYIEIVTTAGTAVIEILVRGMLPYAFDKFIGVEKSVIYETLGAYPIEEEDDVIVYQNLTDEIQYLRIGLNLLSGRVSDIRLYISNNVKSGYVDRMTEYLERLYENFDKGTTETYKAYINSDQLQSATVGVTWDIPNMQITYVAINHDLFTDYSPLLGKTQDEVKYIMKDSQLFREDKYQLAYAINDGNIDLVGCYYTYDFVNTLETAIAIIAVLNDNLQKQEVLNYLKEKYIYLEDESTDMDKVFLTADGLIAIFYTPEYKQVQYQSNVSTSKFSSYVRIGVNSF